MHQRIFIAGHTGLIGSALVRLLTKKGIPFLTKNSDELDLTKLDQVHRFFEEYQPTHVVLAAGKAAGIVENQNNPASLMHVNLLIQTNVMHVAAMTHVKRLIYFGSSCMYPKVCPQPMSEESLWSAAPEITSLPYASAKLAGVQLCLAYNRAFGENRFIPLIPSSVYGPYDNFDGQTGHVLASLIAKFHTAKTQGHTVRLWGSGSPRREFLHADDLATACLNMLDGISSVEFLPLNVGAGTDISIRELAEKIAHICGYGGDIDWDTTKPDGAARKLLDSSKMALLGWKSAIDLNQGLASTYRWYLENCIPSEV